MQLDISGLLTQFQRDQLTVAAKATLVAAIGDSNDEEIEALQEFRDIACQVLGIDLDELDDD